MGKNSALICIPDITGFTSFLNKTELSLSKEIIGELLEALIDGNNLNLKISEIEGDAILFYRFGELPTVVEMVEQSRLFYQKYYDKIQELSEKNKLHEEFRQLRNSLGLKIIYHCGEIEQIQVDTYSKLIGKEIIVAHKLLKNQVELTEYVLISDDLVKNFVNDSLQKEVKSRIYKGHINNKNLGKTSFVYFDIREH